MGGTDIVDQRMSYYSINSNSNRWTMSAFSYIQDRARVNAQTLWSLNNGQDLKKYSSFTFGMNLAVQLIKPNIIRRPTTHLIETVRMKIKQSLSPTIAENEDNDIEENATSAFSIVN